VPSPCRPLGVRRGHGPAPTGHFGTPRGPRPPSSRPVGRPRREPLARGGHHRTRHSAPWEAPVGPGTLPGCIVSSY
jgi:hypothetical protein